MLGGDGEVELDAVAGEDVVDDGEGGVGGVALGGQVGEVDVFEAGMGDVDEGFSGALVGEVAGAGEDALFVDHRAGRGVDHGGFVVGFEVEVVGVLEGVFDERSGEAEVGAEAEFEVVCADGESDRVEGVVRDRKRVDFKVHEFKRLTCGKDFKFRAVSQIFDNPFGRLMIGKDGDAIAQRKCFEPRDMIGMFMSDEDGVDLI